MGFHFPETLRKGSGAQWCRVDTQSRLNRFWEEEWPPVPPRDEQAPPGRIKFTVALHRRQNATVAFCCLTQKPLRCKLPIGQTEEGHCG